MLWSGFRSKSFVFNLSWRRPTTALCLALASLSAFSPACCLCQVRRFSIWTGTSTTGESPLPWLLWRICSPSLDCLLQIKLSMDEDGENKYKLNIVKYIIKSQGLECGSYSQVLDGQWKAGSVAHPHRFVYQTKSFLFFFLIRIVENNFKMIY